MMFTGTGYQLTMTKEPQSMLEPITNTIKGSVAGAVLKSAHTSQLTYSVPQEAAAKMPGLFSTIEREKDKLGIKGVGISCTTMEEVFLKWVFCILFVIKNFVNLKKKLQNQS